MGHYNSIVASFESDPRGFEPTFYESKLDGKTLIVVDEWCAAFVKGMRLDSPGGKPLKRDRPDLLESVELFGTRTGWRKLKAGGDAAMHAIWSPRIAPAVREIYAFWLPHRRQVLASRGRCRH